MSEIEPTSWTAGVPAGEDTPVAPDVAPNKGWRSRGYLPHCDQAGLVQHIVFSLSDSIPPGRRIPSVQHGERTLDEHHGCCLLRDSSCASLVQSALLHADGDRYRLIAWCVMPNHVHVIVEQAFGYPLDKTVQGWKSTSAHEINKLLNRRGQVWRREYFDRFMRDNDHLSTTVQYVEDNPVNAKLISQAEQWRWSSAFARRNDAGEDAGGPRI